MPWSCSPNKGNKSLGNKFKGGGVTRQGEGDGDDEKVERTDPFSPPISSVCWVFGPLPPGWSTTEHTLCSSIYHREIGESARVVELAVQVAAWEPQDPRKPEGNWALWLGHISLTSLHVCGARMCSTANGLSYPLNIYARPVTLRCTWQVTWSSIWPVARCQWQTEGRNIFQTDLLCYECISYTLA